VRGPGGVGEWGGDGDGEEGEGCAEADEVHVGEGMVGTF
jgi:hypothetical protein